MISPGRDVLRPGDALDRVDGESALSSPLRTALEHAGFQREYLGLVLRLPPLSHPQARSA